ncbi:MAG TPA: hypothetical protein VH164_11335, partial [Ktedonobacteraceae bacterium]|nr:hypothetical protein [Ktedonobacteraceae bacterium]
RTEEEALSMGGLEPRTDQMDTSIDPRERQPVREPTPDREREPEPADEEEEQETRQVDYTLPGGRVIKVDRSTAELFRAQEDRYNQELADLRRSLPAAGPAGTAAPNSGPDADPLKDFDENLFLVDPKQAARKLYDIVNQDVSKNLTQRYTADQQYQLYMNTFYNRFPDYRGLEDVVQAVLNQNRPMLAAMEPGRGQERLAELCKAHVDRLVSKFAPGYEQEEDQPIRRTQLERGNSQPSRRESRPAPQEQQKARSISDIIRQRRAERARPRATR